MKFIDLLATANHNLFRNKTRTILTILAIFVGSFVIILSNAINTGVNDFIDEQVASIGGDGYIEISPSAVYDQIATSLGGDKIPEYSEETNKTVDTSYIDEATLDKLRAVDGVKSLNPYHQISTEYVTSEKTDKKYQLASINLIPDNSLNREVIAGGQVDADASEYQVAIGQDFVSVLGFSSDEDAIGQTITIGVPVTAKCYLAKTRSECTKTVTAKIVGVAAPSVLTSSNNISGNNALYEQIFEVNAEGLDETSKLAYMATGNVDPEKLDSIRKEFEDLGFTVMTIEDQVGMIRTFFDVILVVFNIFGGIALVAAAIGIINTLFMSVQERTREIGLMKAMGMSRSKIFLSFSLEAILLGFWGSIIGIALSMLFGFGGNALAHETFLTDFPTFELVIFKFTNMLVIVLIIMAIAFVAGTAPAYRASKQNPIDALRYE